MSSSSEEGDTGPTPAQIVAKKAALVAAKKAAEVEGWVNTDRKRLD